VVCMSGFQFFRFPVPRGGTERCNPGTGPATSRRTATRRSQARRRGRPPLHQSGPLWSVRDAGLTPPLGATPPRMRHLYRSPGGRLETPRAQFDVLRSFSDIKCAIFRIRNWKAPEGLHFPLPRKGADRKAPALFISLTKGQGGRQLKDLVVICNTSHPGTRKAPPTEASEVRFGTGSDFGFPNPFPFFDLLTSRSETTCPRFGIGSVSVGVRSRQQKARYDSSTCSFNNNELVFLLIPWSQVRVLAGPPPPMASTVGKFLRGTRC